MPQPMSQFSLRVAGDEADPALVERFALELRAELAEAVRVDQVPAGPAPEGTRGLELLAAFGFVITMVQAGEAVATVVAAIRTVAARYARHRERLRVTLDGVDID